MDVARGLGWTTPRAARVPGPPAEGAGAAGLPDVGVDATADASDTPARAESRTAALGSAA
jgi:hypothetical protein